MCVTLCPRAKFVNMKRQFLVYQKCMFRKKVSTDIFVKKKKYITKPLYSESCYKN